MGVYCEPITDELILKKVEGVKNVALIVCPGCACESLAYYKSLPNRLISSEGKDMEQSAVAVCLESDRLMKMLESKGISVERCLVAFPCEMFASEREHIRKVAEGKDVVLVLACAGGFVGVRDVLVESDIKIVPLMKSMGTFVLYLVPDENGVHSVVDKEKSKIVRFKQLKKEE